VGFTFVQPRQSAIGGIIAASREANGEVTEMAINNRSGKYRCLP